MHAAQNDPNNWIPRDVFESCVGSSSRKLLSYYDTAIQKQNMNVPSLNWGAIICLPAWLGYRRRWIALATLTVLFSLSSFIEALVDFSIPATAFIGMWVAFGMMANGLLLAAAHKA